MWSPIVGSELYYSRVKHLVDDLYEKVKEQVLIRDDFSLYFGAGGLCLFLAHYRKVYKSNSQLFKEDPSTHRILEHLLESSFEFSIDHTTDLTRYAELGALIVYLDKHELFEIDIENVCSDLDRTLIKLVPALSEGYSFDLLGGVVSIGLYYHLRLPSNIDHFHNILSSIVDRLYSAAIRRDGMIMWPSIIEIGSNAIGFNLGLAHGIPGIVLFLRKMFIDNISVEKTRELIKGAVRFLLSQMHLPSPQGGAVFYDVCDLEYDGEDSRLSWCYGDLGIAYAFVLLSQTEGLDCYELKDVGLRIFRSTTHRVTLRDARVCDAGLCHGCFGISHIYNRAFHLVGEPFLLDMALYWFQEGLKMSNNTRQDYGGFLLTCFSDDDDPKSVDGYNLSFQTGIAGIGLALLAGIEPEIPSWDYFLLLS